MDITRRFPAIRLPGLPEQRMYVHSHAGGILGLQNEAMCPSVRVTRSGRQAFAVVEIDQPAFGHARIRLDADRLRRLASDMLDAADDIDPPANAVALPNQPGPFGRRPSDGTVLPPTVAQIDDWHGQVTSAGAA